MEAIETLALFEEKVAVTPRDLANPKINIQSLLLAKLASKIEGKCSLHGWVLPDSIKVLSRSMGYVEKGRFTGDIVFHVQAEAKVLNPPSGSHLIGQVVGNNMMGMYVSYRVKMREVDRKTKKVTMTPIDAIKVILPRDLHMGDEEFSKIQIGDSVNVEIKKSRFQVNDKYILSVGIFQGKAGSTYVAPEVEEVYEAEVIQEGPSKVAAVGLTKFEDTEEERLKKEMEEKKKLVEEEELVFEGDTTETTGPTLGYRTTGTDMALPYAIGEPLYFNAMNITTFKELDNRYPAKFTLDGKLWPTVEHYYQAMKFPTLPEFQEQIRKASTATAAGKLGKKKDPSKPIRADWNEKRELIMNAALVAKFKQNPAVEKVLLDTYPRPLIFSDPNDSFWGNGPNKTGKNKLGTLLMEYRGSKRGMEALDG